MHGKMTQAQRKSRSKKRDRRAKKRAEEEAKKPSLYDGLSKCLESGHVSMATFPVQGADGISRLHACKRCGLMYWEE